MITFNSDKYRGRWSELDDFYKDYKFNKKNMQNGLLKLSWGNVRSALVYGVVAGVVAVVMYMISVGDVFALSWHALVNGFVFGLITSLVKNLGTTNDNNFIGVVSTAP
jgi:hypothetical protein